jgi:peptidoglycan/LPS O-acetylase OafA/YrhL
LSNALTDTRHIPFKYTPQLSGLRFAAVIFVVLYHFSQSLMNFKRVFDLGVFIAFFFVLSSYLITRILLDAKRKAVDKGFAKWKVAVAFLIRRTLRIFPGYYVYLFLIFLLPLEAPEVREHLQMFIFYLSNILIYITKSWGPLTGHLWTLAVEEQFYLIWPWIILFSPNRYLPGLLAAITLVAVVFRITAVGHMQDFNREIFPVLSLMPSALDSFAIGGLLALAHYNGHTSRYKWLDLLVLLIIPVWIFLILTDHRRSFEGLNRLFVSIFSAAILHKANRGYKGVMGRVLENNLVQYLSKISYGIYLYHMLASVYFRRIFDAAADYFRVKQGWDPARIREWVQSPFISFWIYLLIAIGLATLSWYCVEQPFNNIRKLIFYVSTKKKKQPVSAS